MIKVMKTEFSLCHVLQVIHVGTYCYTLSAAQKVQATEQPMPCIQLNITKSLQLLQCLEWFSNKIMILETQFIISCEHIVSSSFYNCLIDYSNFADSWVTTHADHCTEL
jgi:hypothetical protein